jgi:hypothetical protein
MTVHNKLEEGSLTIVLEIKLFALTLIRGNSPGKKSIMEII